MLPGCYLWVYLGVAEMVSVGASSRLKKSIHRFEVGIFHGLARYEMSSRNRMLLSRSKQYAAKQSFIGE